MRRGPIGLMALRTIFGYGRMRKAPGIAGILVAVDALQRIGLVGSAMAILAFIGEIGVVNSPGYADLRVAGYTIRSRLGMVRRLIVAAYAIGICARMQTLLPIFKNTMACMAIGNGISKLIVLKRNGMAGLAGEVRKGVLEGTVRDLPAGFRGRSFGLRHRGLGLWSWLV